MTVPLPEPTPGRARYARADWVNEKCHLPETAALLREAADALTACPFCGHDWGRHDPEDGRCDSHSRDEIGVCRCGRDLAWMQQRIAAAARAVLADGDTAA